MLIVQKFGGTSLADAGCIRSAAQKAMAQQAMGNRVVMVVSAQGHTTDGLIQKARELSLKPPMRELDALLACGEQMSAALVAMALQDMGCDAVSLTGWQAGVHTDGTQGNAMVEKVACHRILQELEKGRVVVVTGFQGLGPNGDITTLGRGGSDTTAVALAAYLKADRCLIYTDVDGVYDKDPRKFPDAVRYDRIGYEQMLRMAQGGAQVLHDRCVELAQRHGVRLQVLSAFREGPGTLVE